MHTLDTPTIDNLERLADNGRRFIGLLPVTSKPAMSLDRAGTLAFAWTRGARERFTVYVSDGGRLLWIGAGSRGEYVGGEGSLGDKLPEDVAAWITRSEGESAPTPSDRWPLNQCKFWRSILVEVEIRWPISLRDSPFLDSLPRFLKVHELGTLRRWSYGETDSRIPVVDVTVETPGFNLPDAPARINMVAAWIEGHAQDNG